MANLHSQESYSNNTNTMGKACSEGQFRELVGKLLVKVPFENMDGGKVQVAIDQPDALAERFILFMNDEQTNGAAVATPPTRIFNFEERDGVIYFSVTSNGMSGKEWLVHFEKTGKRVSKYAQDLLLSDAFKPTSGVTTPIQVLKGMLWNDRDRTTKNIRAKAKERKLLDPNPEVACLIRDMFTDAEIEAMGLWWIAAMHEPIKDSDGDPHLLFAGRHDGGRWLRAACDGPGNEWDREDGFAFASPQV